MPRAATYLGDRGYVDGSVTASGHAGWVFGAKTGILDKPWHVKYWQGTPDRKSRAKPQ